MSFEVGDLVYDIFYVTEKIFRVEKIDKGDVYLSLVVSWQSGFPRIVQRTYGQWVPEGSVRLLSAEDLVGLLTEFPELQKEVSPLRLLARCGDE